MSLARMTELVHAAALGGKAIGAFNVVTIESAEAIAMAAESLDSPVILQVSQNTVEYHRGLHAIGKACRAIAQDSHVPIAVHLDHAVSLDLCRVAAEVGFGSVMFDGSALPFDVNVERTRTIVDWAQALGIGVEAELGHVGGKAGDEAASELTDPDEARRFVELTGVDVLAVSVGTAHHMTDKSAVVDLDRVRQLRAQVDVALVLHGSSGLTHSQLRAVVKAGIAKVNIATRLNMSFTRGVRATLEADPSLHDLRRYLGAGREAMAMAAAEEIAALQGRPQSASQTRPITAVKGTVP